jgi:DNA polymerase zeta
MGTKFKSYESHLSYYLQFMCDHGLYGCGWVDLGNEVFLRGKDADRSESEDERVERLQLPPSPYFKQSHLSLELDTCAHQIQNRHLIEARDINSTLRIPASTPSAEPLVHSVRELWEDERRRRIANGLSASPDMPKLLSERKRGKGGEWVDLNRLQLIVDGKCERETKEGKIYRERNKSWENWVMSTFESVEALWESSKRTWKPTRLEDQDQFKMPSGDLMPHEETNDTTELDVDENLLSSQDMDKLMRDEEQQGAIPDREDQDNEDDSG